MTGFHAGDVVLAKIAVPYRAHFSGFDQVWRRRETIDLKPDGDTSILLMAEPAFPIVVAGIYSRRTKIEQSNTIQAPAQRVSVAITRDCDLPLPQYAAKAVRSRCVPQAVIERLPKRLGNSGIVHGSRFVSNEDSG